MNIWDSNIFEYEFNLKYSLIVLRERKTLFGKSYFFPRNQFSNKI
ncbi:hypothetical protein LEP1GSC024_1813 [Leptospira noguchii str. 2001034031]|uniref:Uncharacterized protein n=2 Tax=Leptospira noguchii TaxID=28182 RepID=M6Y8W2_9LEPT|nr:hypothetical protein LEP1GSC024_1813 [Leptospira noguchii str. 2001034031]